MQFSPDEGATFALWSIRGLGLKTMKQLSDWAGGGFSSLWEKPMGSWLESSPLPIAFKRALEKHHSLPQLAGDVSSAAERGGMKVAFRGRPPYPERLAEAHDAPPVLFFRGELGGGRKRVALVGTRHPDAGFLPYARTFASELAEAGIGVVSGAAMGVDRACHLGAMDAQGETWAFLGCALDAMDATTAAFASTLLHRGGAVLSELPPGTRATSFTFPRRNRLISGASDAVVVMRAAVKSGSFHTASAARRQGRRVFALPGEVTNEAAAGCNRLIRDGEAQLCSGAGDVLQALGAASPRRASSPSSRLTALKEVSAAAREALRWVSGQTISFEEVAVASGMDAGALTSALCELELFGLVVQLPGKLYQKT
jgi:DNA processing protein